ncbi:MAG: serine protease [Sorangiineae bacterium PRO1]|nr:serine protease [Sorangiineae bacterium PRO1]
MLGPVNARPFLHAASLGWVLFTLGGSALAQATPPSPFRSPDPPPTPLEKAVEVDPSTPPPFIAGEAKVDPNEKPLDRARRQVVALLRAGKPIGVGTVLAGDGRILTALSPLGHGNDVDARFADGSTTRVRLIQSDRAWDLALVAPAARRSDVGLRASRGSASTKDAKLTAFSPGPKDLATVAVRVKETAKLVGGDNAQLDGALVLASKHKASELGSPVIDERGDVVAVLSQACAPPADKGCTLAPYAAPVAAIKDFLRSVTAASPQPAPPFGIRGVAHDAGAVKGVRVLSVTPRSRAAAAGLRPGADTIVAVGGAAVTTPEALADALRARSGQSVELLVFGAGRYREVRMSLRGPERPGFRRMDPWKRQPGFRQRPRANDPGY